MSQEIYSCHKISILVELNQFIWISLFYQLAAMREFYQKFCMSMNIVGTWFLVNIPPCCHLSRVAQTDKYTHDPATSSDPKRSTSHTPAIHLSFKVPLYYQFKIILPTRRCATWQLKLSAIKPTCNLTKTRLSSIESQPEKVVVVVVVAYCCSFCCYSYSFKSKLGQ